MEEVKEDDAAAAYGMPYATDDEDDDLVSLLGLGPMPFAAAGLHHNNNHHHALHPSSSFTLPPGQQSPPPPHSPPQQPFIPATPAAAKALHDAALFRKSFRATSKVRSLRIESFGYFPANVDEVQLVGLYQPIPNELTCSFTMYEEPWTSHVRYVPAAAATEYDPPVLEFTITSVRTGQVTSLVERPEDAAMRRKSKRSVLICNKVFDLACQSLPDKPNQQCSTNESGALFGLKDGNMLDFVLQWYAQQAGCDVDVM